MTSSIIENFPSIWKIIAANDTINCVNIPKIDHDLFSGIYTTLKIYPGKKVYQFKRHMQRLTESAQLSGFEFNFSEKKLRQSLRSVLDRFHTESLKAQILVFPKNGDLEIYYFISKAPVYQDEGVKAMTRTLSRNNPKAKRTDFILQSSKEKNSLPNDIEEILMVTDDGTILEGMSSNFFGVSQNAIWTAEEGVLFGTTRKTILSIITDSGFDIVPQGFHLENLGQLDEAFISSVSRGVLPVLKINNQMIGSGKPGQTTILIKQRYDEIINQDLETL